jgi:hypothetical protein
VSCRQTDIQIGNRHFADRFPPWHAGTERDRSLTLQRRLEAGEI